MVHGAEDALEGGQGASESSETSSEGGDVQQQDTEMAEAGSDEVQIVEDSGDEEDAEPAEEAPVRWGSYCTLLIGPGYMSKAMEESGDEEDAEPVEEAPVRNK